MKFGDFLFPESSDPACDGEIIDDALAEARLCDELGMDAIWLAEHHFDGNCAYVDPLTFAAALAVATKRAELGFAVLQTSLYHPIRLAEQLSLLDHLSKGRLILGLGRGTFFNIYEYQGYGIDADEVQARFEEAEEILRKAWTSKSFEHRGRFWNLRAPGLRPRPYTKPHPEIYRATSSESSLRDCGRQGRPILLNPQTNATTRQRVDIYRQGMREGGFSEEDIARNVGKIWVWRSIYVGPTDAAAESVGRPAFTDDRAPKADARSGREGAGRQAVASSCARAARLSLWLTGDRRSRIGGTRRHRHWRCADAVSPWRDAIRNRRRQYRAVHARSRAAIPRQTRGCRVN